MQILKVASEEQGQGSVLCGNGADVSLTSEMFCLNTKQHLSQS